MADTNTKTKPAPKNPSAKAYILFSVAAALLLIIANSAIWFNNYIFNGDKFTQLTTQAVQEESSRTAIATEITDQLLEKRPTLKGVIDEPTVKLISGLLDSNVAQAALNKTVSQFQTILTSKDPQDVSFDLSSIKQTVSQVIGIAGNVTDRNTDNAEDRIENIPDSITILRVSNLPNIYGLGVALLWVAPIATLIALGLLIYPLYKARHSRRISAAVLATEGVVLSIASIFALALGPLFKPPIVANVPNENMRVVVENIYQVFISKFNGQVSTMFMLGVLLLIGAAVVFWSKPVATRITKR